MVSRPIPLHDEPTMERVRELVMLMRETMYDARGWGLSAVQIGVPAQVFIVHHPSESKLPLTFVNPVIMGVSDELTHWKEGCLSFKGAEETISRPKTVTVQHNDECGRSDIHTYTGWTARIILHEFDHLNGTLMIDHLKPATKQWMLRKMKRTAASKSRRRRAA